MSDSRSIDIYLSGLVPKRVTAAAAKACQWRGWVAPWHLGTLTRPLSVTTE